jgi:hypothetical protein
MLAKSRMASFPTFASSIIRPYVASMNLSFIFWRQIRILIDEADQLPDPQ